MNLEIRKAESSDINSLAVLKQQVWISTYATEGIVDEYSSYVLSEFSVENVKKSLENVGSITLVAVCNNNLVGCVEIVVSPQRPIEEIEPCIEITTLYVLERFQNKGIGKELLNETMKIIEILNFNKMWLSVYHKNEKAIDFYQKQKFIRIGEMDFQLGKEGYMNYIMIRNLKE